MICIWFPWAPPVLTLKMLRHDVSRGRRHQGMDSHCSILSPKRLRRGKPVQERWRITIEEHSSNLDILVSVKSAVLRGAAMPIVGWLLKEGQKNILP